MLYLLHFERPHGRFRHYLGTCREDRLEERLLEHARGSGSNITKRVVATGNQLYLARVFPVMMWEDEKRLKRASHFKNLCPLCCPLFADLKTRVRLIDPKHGTPLPRFAIWDWRPRTG